MISQPLAAAFVRPVDPALVPGYAEVVLKPMDLVSKMADCPVTSPRRAVHDTIILLILISNNI